MEKLNELIDKYHVLELESRITAGQEEMPSIRKIYVGVAQIYSDFQEDLKQLTESHKREVMEAWEAGLNDSDPYNVKHQSASDYYEKTFGTQTHVK